MRKSRRDTVFTADEVCMLLIITAKTDPAGWDEHAKDAIAKAQAHCVITPDAFVPGKINYYCPPFEVVQ